MRAIKAIGVYAAFVIVLGALLAPWMFWAVHPFLPDVPFRRVFDRVLLVLALAGLWPLLRALGLRTWAELGLAKRREGWSEMLTGFCLGCVSFGIGGATLLVLGLRTIDEPVTNVAGILLGALATGIAVGFIEEIFFRGGLQGALQRGMRLPVAILIASAIYSALHFMKPKGAGIRAESVNWLSGIEYLGRMITKFGSEPGVVLGFVTLLLAGCVLGLAFARTRSLYVSIGIHAGWVFTLRTFSAITDAAGRRQWWGGTTLVDNMLVWPVLLALLGFVAWRYRSR